MIRRDDDEDDGEEGAEDDHDGEPEELVALPIDGVLDLHTFSPREVKSLVAEYLDECGRRGITEVRLIHGKGTGTLRRTVHAVLQRHPEVLSYGAAPETEGGWGATWVRLRGRS